METAEQIEARLRVELAAGIPVQQNGALVVIAPESLEFEAVIASSVQAVLGRQNRAAARAASQDNKRALVLQMLPLLYADLETLAAVEGSGAPVPLSAERLRAILARVLRAEIGLIRALVAES